MHALITAHVLTESTTTIASVLTAMSATVVKVLAILLCVYMNSLQLTYTLSSITITVRYCTMRYFVVSRTRLHVTDKAFSITEPRAWNALPSDIKLTSSRTSFRKKLKTHFFSLL